MSVLKIDFKFPDWFGRMKKAEKRIGLFIAANMQENRAELFQASGAFNGHKPWKKPLFRNGKPLMDRGTLKNSIGPSNASNEPITAPNGIIRIQWPKVTIGTNLGYAKINNEGGIIKAKNAQALAIPLPSGKKATAAAKSARKDSVGKKDLEHKIKSLSGDFRRASSMKERMTINKKINRYKSAHSSGPKNQRVIFLKQVTIPARNFSSITIQDQREINMALKNLVVGILNRE